MLVSTVTASTAGCATPAFAAAPPRRRRSAHHRRPARRVHVDDGGRERHDRADRARHRVRDVVELEVEEDGASADALGDRLHAGRAVRPKELEAQLDPKTSGALQPVRHRHRRVEVRCVDGDEESVGRLDRHFFRA